MLEKLLNIDLNLDPTRITIDFEMTALNAFEKVFQ